MTAEKKMETWDWVRSIVGGNCAQSDDAMVCYSSDMCVV